MSFCDVLSPFGHWDNLSLRREITIDSGKGIYVYDSHGRKYIEGLSGLWNASLGFGDEELCDAIASALRRLSSYHCAIHRLSRSAEELAETLIALSPAESKKVFLVNSGSEATDTQIKFLWLYNNSTGRPKKKKILCLSNSYHGSTVGACGLSGASKFQEGFDVEDPRFVKLSCPYYSKAKQADVTEEHFIAELIDELERVIETEGSETIAGCIVEPVLGAAGVFVPPVDYFSKLGALLHRNDIRLIADEVICGFGRTGTMWASEQLQLQPDTVSCAKGMTSGTFPLGAVLIDGTMADVLERRAKNDRRFAHGFTTGGHPVACVAALKTIEIIQKRNILDSARKRSVLLLSLLGELKAQFSIVFDVRLIGLLAAVEIAGMAETGPDHLEGVAIANQCVALACDRGLLLRSMGPSIIICPPLIITDEELRAMISILAEVLSDIGKELPPQA